MMRISKVLFLLIITIISLLGGVFYYLYNTLNFKEVSLYETVPSESVLAILNSRGLVNFNNVINDSSSIFYDISQHNALEKIVHPIRVFDQAFNRLQDTSLVSNFLNRNFLLSIHLNGDKSLSSVCTFNIKNRNEKGVIATLFKSAIKEDIFNKFQFFSIESAQNTKDIYFALNNGLFIISDSKELIISSINQLNSPKLSLLSDVEFSKVYNVSRNISFDNLFIKLDRLHLFSKSLAQNVIPHLSTNFYRWAEYDVDFKKDALSMNGIILQNSTKQELYQFIKDNSEKLTLDYVFPAYTTHFVNYSFKETYFFKQFTSFLKANYKYEDIISKDSINTLASFVEPIQKIMAGEFGLAIDAKRNDSILIIKINSIAEARLAFSSLSKKYQYSFLEVENWKVDNTLSMPIYSGLPSNTISYIFDPFFEVVPNKYLFLFDDYIAISNDIDDLKQFYLNYISKNTLSNSKSFCQFRNNFSLAESQFIYSSDKASDLISESTSSNYTYTLASQSDEKNNTLFSSIVLERSISLASDFRGNVRSLLDSSLITIPAIVIHPINNEVLFLVQDLKFNLYLINTIGRIIWKRPIEEAILGDIIQFSINNKVQNGLIFNTRSKLFQIDFNGNSIGNYPVVLPFKSMSPLALFDYENSGDFRLFVPCEDRNVRVYDKKGNIVLGFETDKLEGNVIKEIQHFNVYGKDYILLSDNFSNRILDRKGKPRIAIKDDFKRGSNSNYYYAKEGKLDYFITSSINGEIVKIEVPTGLTTLISCIENDSEHYFFQISINKHERGYLFLHDKSISLFAGNGKLIFSKYLPINEFYIPRLVYNNQIPYIAFIDNNQIYLVNIITGEVQNNFPVNGFLDYQLFFSSNGDAKVVTGGDHNSLIFYNNIVF